MPSKVWDGNTYLFPNFNGCTVEVLEWISNFISHILELKLTHVRKRDHWNVKCVWFLAGSVYMPSLGQQCWTLIFSLLSVWRSRWNSRVVTPWRSCHDTVNELHSSNHQVISGFNDTALICSVTLLHWIHCCLLAPNGNMEPVRHWCRQCCPAPYHCMNYDMLTCHRLHLQEETSVQFNHD